MEGHLVSRLYMQALYVSFLIKILLTMVFLSILLEERLDSKLFIIFIYLSPNLRKV